MAKSTDNKSLKRSKYLQMLKGFSITLILFTSITIFSQKSVGLESNYSSIDKIDELTLKQEETINKKINDFEKLTDDEKTKEIYREVIETKVKTVTPTINVKGTEYQVGDMATIFLQLLDENKQPVSNSSCFMSIWYPNKAIWVNNSLMSNLGTDGIYYYDTVAPINLGVYMVSAYCYIPSIILNETNISYDGFECGGFNCGYGWLNSSWDTSGSIIITTDNNPIGTYHTRLRNANAYMDRYFNMSADEYNNYDDVKLEFSVKTRGWENSDYGDVNVYDAYGDYHTIREWWNGEDDNIYRTYSFNLKEAQYTNVTGCGFFMDGNADNDRMFVDEVRLVGYDYIVGNESEYQIVRGSGEIHVGNITFSGNITANLTETNNLIINTNSTIYNETQQIQVNQQEIYNFIQTMNTTMVDNQNYIISLINNVSTQIDEKWQDFWDTARARILS